MKLEDVIRSKGTSVVTIEPQASVIALVTLMADNNIGAVVVSADGVHIDGIVSERDVVRGLVSIGDVVKFRIDQLTDERNHLLGYLHQ